MVFIVFWLFVFCSAFTDILILNERIVKWTRLFLCVECILRIFRILWWILLSGEFFPNFKTYPIMSIEWYNNIIIWRVAVITFSIWRAGINRTDKRWVRWDWWGGERVALNEKKGFVESLFKIKENSQKKKNKSVKRGERCIVLADLLFPVIPVPFPMTYYIYHSDSPDINIQITILLQRGRIYFVVARSRNCILIIY